MPIRIIGAGLAGPEAAWQCARRGLSVDLYEMRPQRKTPAHETDLFAELVCSNSLKSDSENSAPWLLKQEMRHAGSLLMEMAARTAVPAGHALAVDRLEFSRLVTETIATEPLIRLVREEVTSLEGFDGVTILATGPLTSDALAAEIQRLSGTERLFFFDSISPIVEADSIDHSKVYMAARYDKGTADYINCPMMREEYDAFIAALAEAQRVDGHDWDKAQYFEGCLPIEEIARLENAKFLRYGQIHRNTYINAPTLLTPTLQMKQHPRVLFAGQISGVEGYVESIATGLLAGVTAAAIATGVVPIPAPRASAHGSLTNYICGADSKDFQPANITFDLLEQLDEATKRKVRDKKLRHQMVCERAFAEFGAWFQQVKEILPTR